MSISETEESGAGPSWTGRRLGAWAMLGSAHVLPPLAAAGFDWICIDQQHGRFDDAAMFDGLGALRDVPIDAVVRVRSLDAGLIGRALDAGAHGVIVPMVASAEQAADAVRATYYPPLGERSWGPIGAGAGASPSAANDAVLCAVMVETPGALAAVDRIAATPGIGMIFVGPFDLSLALQRNVDEMLADFADSSPLQRIIRACQRTGVVPGAFGGTPERASLLLKHGFTFVVMATDIVTVTRGGELLLKEATG